jgi:hypothetical protein
VNLATLDVDTDDARGKLAEYRAALAKERNAEDEAIAAAYRAAARGLPIISLTAAITAGGFFEDGLPRMAICRADAQQCWVQWDWRDQYRLVFTDTAQEWGRGALVGNHTVTVLVDRPSVPAGYRSSRGGSTVVPPVPPRFRPKRARLSGLHILWEVEKWDPTPPRDPALLRHIRGDLWAVLAVWDLTEIERHVLSQRVERAS